MKTKIPTDWSYNRRVALARDVQSAIYLFERTLRIPHRSFHDEAQKKLPTLYAAIERHNKRACKLKAVADQKINRFEMSKKAHKVALYGTNKECEALADKWLLKQARKK